MTAPVPREEVPAAHRWRLEALYETDEAWEQDFRASEGFAPAIEAHRGRLGSSAQALASALAEYFANQRALEKLATYAYHRRDEDLSRARYQDMASRITTRAAAYQASSAFLRPEILAIDPATIEAWLQAEELRPYAVWLGYLLRYRPHTLSPSEERIVALAEEPLAGFQRAFGMLNNVDRPRRLPTIVDANGTPVQLSNANFGSFMESPDRRVRHDAFTGFYQELAGNVDTLATLLDSEVRAHVFLARVRGYSSALEASLFHDQVDVAVYDALISSVRGALGGLHDYIRLRRDALGLDALHMYDIMAPIVPSWSKTYSYDEAVEMILEGLAPLGADYVDELRRGLEAGWVDPFENRGKRSGAYSGGCYDSYPYILHNFNGTLQAVFTLAHEAGHSMHSLYSRRHQPYHMASYPILLAEVASVTNEILLLRWLLAHATDDSERAALLDHLLTDFRATVFRQTMFAEFERTIHTHVEQGGSLTCDYLNDLYFGLVRDYYGEACSYDGEDRLIRLEWGRIPHFYYDFYVYKYATGMASAVAIGSRIAAGDEKALANYRAFLCAGSSKPPLELLKDTGIDLASGEPMSGALAQVLTLVRELSEVLRGSSPSPSEATTP